MKIFVTGASGFIGGSVAARLVQAGHEVRGLIRDAAKAADLRAHGIEPVVGTLDDHDLLTREAKAADAVVNAASSDNRGAADALIAALAGSGKALIHTSGSSIVGDEAMGEPSERVFGEDTEFTPEPDKEARIALDNAVLAAPGVRGVVLCNTLIYGDALGPKAQSVQLPRLVAQARASGVAPYIGRGLNRWSNVHIADVADLYLLALDKAPAGTFAFVENGEAAFGEMAQAIGEALGLETRSMDRDAAEALWGREMAVFALGSNSRVRGQRARDLGWTPKHGSVVEWIKAGVR
ncbi:nucleoside-diphosphate-sugar epimerase [Caulobacter sp. AP07]|uniref:NAD-dependent epimerase/dehydratase family protein n=1 Tax=Caulobacter sp. AP07 TaxID=1144304 RepID=UPI00027210DB|nr:NAD-dependent epimerase/dehydratase family protein [Caulobacter sp. AP07]EJL36864.1 nucleoside-diphosphate-sugar epimerase [Caulobacter sp. AP07]